MVRMENERIAKRVYAGKYAGSRSLGRLRKRWIDIMKGCLKKRGLDVRQPRKMVHDRSVWREFGGEWLPVHLCSHLHYL